LYLFINIFNLVKPVAAYSEPLLQPYTSIITTVTHIGEINEKTPQNVADSATNLSTPLIQALSSNDGKMIERILSINDLRLIHSTVESIPSSYAPQLMQVIVYKLSSSARKTDVEFITKKYKHHRPVTENITLNLYKWLRCLLIFHNGILRASLGSLSPSPMSLVTPSLSFSLQHLHLEMRKRTRFFQQWVNLKGRLNFVVMEKEKGKVNKNDSKQVEVNEKKEKEVVKRNFKSKHMYLMGEDYEEDFEPLFIFDESI
jgi:hypothetical protein